MVTAVATDRAVSQKFSAQDAPAKTSGSSDVVERKCVGVMKWYIQMPTLDTAQSWSLILWPEEIWSVTKSASEWMGTSLEPRAHSWTPSAEK